MTKTNLLILFGGESNEHEISCRSAYNIISAVDKELYDVTLIGITKDGKWYLFEEDISMIKDGSWINNVKYHAFISPSKAQSGVVIIKENEAVTVKIDVCFPVLHGLNGEDGTMQGLLQLAGIPCVGGNCLSTALAMDKKFSKIILESENIPVVPAHYITPDDNIDEVADKLNFPVFVKPSNSGSSVGCHKVENKNELAPALKDAFKTDRSVLIEDYVDCREIEFAIMGNDELFVSMPGEITSESTFYDYETKYLKTSGVDIIAPANITDNEKEIMQNYAKKAYKALGLSGFSRADFFIDKKDGKIYLNEINTIPGFTATSMYPFLMEKHGIPCSELINKLIQLAIKRK